MTPGELPERPKGADCKSAGTAFGGSNPSLATLSASAPAGALFVVWMRFQRCEPDTSACYGAGMTTLTVPDAAELLEIARMLAREGAELARRRREEGVELAARKSSITDVVTEADREVEEHIRARLAQLRPEDGFYGEEGDPSTSVGGLNWVVDPIDGTVNYLYGIPHSAVSVAVAEGDPATQPASMRVLAGAVVNIFTGEEWAASLGCGATHNGEALAVEPAPSLAESLVGTGYSYDAAERREQARVWAELAEHTRDVRRMGAAALDLTAVACGRLDIYYERGLKPWDLAAGSLIAREAGAVVKGLGADREGMGMLIAGHPDVVAEFEPRLAAALG